MSHHIEDTYMLKLDGEHICEKKEINRTISIECFNCINNIREPDYCKSGSGCISYRVDCKCHDKIISVIECKICEQYKENINILKDELDELLYNLSYDIKQYEKCKDKIDRLHEISRILREYNRILLEKM